jgi:hypothetical protein
MKKDGQLPSKEKGLALAGENNCTEAFNCQASAFQFSLSTE